jgi:hypothetical protein
LTWKVPVDDRLGFGLHVLLAHERLEVVWEAVPYPLANPNLKM